ncbi:MAG: hypothetical protein QG671_2781, partial [Actinomycetota bacterium]|nr:hypothetical protein [Actinomycetota bacterium]
YEVDLTRAARRALAEALPLDVAIGVADFLTGPLPAPSPRTPTALARNSTSPSKASARPASCANGASSDLHFPW